jgi:formylglycine-generating enzyme required for sulfatase activity
MIKRFFLVLWVLTCLNIVLGQQLSKSEIKSFRKSIGIPEACVYIPQGTLTLEKTTTPVQSFWIYNCEITNDHYNKFLEELKASGNEKDYQIALIKSEKWKLIGKSCMDSIYDTHTAYRLYPVVNISYEARDYFAMADLQTKRQKLEFRLPRKDEWIYAAQCGHQGLSAVYSWGSTFLRNYKGIRMGCYHSLGDESIHQTENGYDIISPEKSTHNYFTLMMAPSQSFYPNDWGLYNMSGNVAEMISNKGIAMGGSWHDTGYDVRTESTQSYTDASPIIGFRPVLVKK